jgi:hypothetical protein
VVIKVLQRIVADIRLRGKLKGNLLAHCGTTMLLFRGFKPEPHNLLHKQARQSLSPHYLATGKSFQSVV